jgi:hypothetical protein
MVLYAPCSARCHADLDLDAIAQGGAEGACELHAVELNLITSGPEVKVWGDSGGERGTRMKS